MLPAARARGAKRRASLERSYNIEFTPLLSYLRLQLLLLLVKELHRGVVFFSQRSESELLWILGVFGTSEDGKSMLFLSKSIHS